MYYRDFAPTGLDPAGAFLPERQEWRVCPTSHTRDSEAIERANFESALEILGGESETVEVHLFGHWGPGWLEIIIVHPSRESEVDSIEASLEDYPVLDEEKLSDLEYSESCEDWERFACSDSIKDTSEALDPINDLSPEVVDEWGDFDPEGDELAKWEEQAFQLYLDQAGERQYIELAMNLFPHPDSPKGALIAAKSLEGKGQSRLFQREG
jgi:hypothetical protein